MNSFAPPPKLTQEEERQLYRWIAKAVVFGMILIVVVFTPIYYYFPKHANQIFFLVEILLCIAICWVMIQVIE